ncbi:MAG: hypothetical protein IPO88_13895 [Nannocystis sp.]|uniref:hypothetical protein n=1 Tax=Nannocystis sp. TaxID=1962667 RepID=UPI00242217B7|nr:hypothetical protein [Nannocystis sp.]MBK9754570.1 hypothetical protein [Nannocystis sp.]
MKHNSWSEINIGKSCAHAQTLARARLASKAWGLALGGMLSSGCILLGSDNDTGQNTDSNGPTTAAGSTTADTTPTTTAAGSDHQRPERIQEHVRDHLGNPIANHRPQRDGHRLHGNRHWHRHNRHRHRRNGHRH